jgi:hypothetical protein
MRRNSDVLDAYPSPRLDAFALAMSSHNDARKAAAAQRARRAIAVGNFDSARRILRRAGLVPQVS